MKQLEYTMLNDVKNSQPILNDYVVFIYMKVKICKAQNYPVGMHAEDSQLTGVWSLSMMHMQ